MPVNVIRVVLYYEQLCRAPTSAIDGIWGTVFEFIQIEVQCSKNYFNFFLPQEAGALGNRRRKGIA